MALMGLINYTMPSPFFSVVPTALPTPYPSYFVVTTGLSCPFFMLHPHTHTQTHTMLSLQTHQSLQSFRSCPQCIHDLKLSKLIIACTLSQNILSDGISYLLECGRSVQKLPILHSIFSNISAKSNAHADKDPCEPGSVTTHQVERNQENKHAT